MENLKTRHNLTFSPEVWKILSLLKETQNKSISEILEQAVLNLVKSEKYNGAYFKIMKTATFCDDVENAELISLLDRIARKDLDIDEEYEI